MKKIIVLLFISLCFMSAGFKQTANCNSIQDKELYSYSALKDYRTLKFDSKTKKYTRDKYVGGMLKETETKSYSINGFKITMGGTDYKVKVCGSTAFILTGINFESLTYYTSCSL